MVMPYNCSKCPENKKRCNWNIEQCMCKRCPRNLAECLIVKYCRETESPIYMEE